MTDYGIIVTRMAGPIHETVLGTLTRDLITTQQYEDLTAPWLTGLGHDCNP